jgi:hypothetical protein
MGNKFAARVFPIVLLALALPRIAAAQNLPAMGPPIPTTLTLIKPAPDQIFGGKTVVTMGINGKNYKFILKDAFTDHPKIRWPDIWEYVNRFNPNFVVQGQDAEAFAKIQPGQTMQVKGMFAPLDRTFEVMSVEQESEPQHY